MGNFVDSVFIFEGESGRDERQWSQTVRRRLLHDSSYLLDLGPSGFAVGLPN